MDLNKFSETLCALPPDEQHYHLDKLITDKYKNSLYLTCKYLLGYKDINWRTHGDMIEALQSNTKRKLIVMPRGTFKSSIGVVGYSIWNLLRNPDMRILIDSEVYTNSKNFLREIKGHLQSEALTSIFGSFYTDTNWNESEITIAQREKNYKEASITCSGIGATKVGQHFDMIIGDDYNSPQNSNTLDGRKKVIDHYRMNTSILEPEGTIAIIGTRYSEDDLIGFILKNEVESE